eukprot:Phypoly_transcript_24670.p1 GENE.Phypoly_transcript_24670~~Phypoly_transcript_24670.p1  ORF type:complete len:100 (+),score=13.51 Phypoly_transcript_24670:173-472(+)
MLNQAEEDGITIGTQHTHGTSDSPMGVPKESENDDTVGPLPNLKRRASTSPTPANTPTWSHDRNISEQLKSTHLNSHLGEFTDSHQDAAAVIWESTLRS